jgi:hypothetical protein
MLRWPVALAKILSAIVSATTSPSKPTRHVYRAPLNSAALRVAGAPRSTMPGAGLDAPIVKRGDSLTFER